MSLEIQQFQFQQKHAVRAFDRDGETWFIAADACRALELEQVTRALDRLDDDEKGLFEVTPGQYVNAVNEPGLYTLVLGSRKPEAREFRRWITHEVIPAIRKTGTYIAKSMSSLDLAEAILSTLRQQEQRIQEHEQRLADVETRQTAMENGSEYYSIIGFASRIGRRVTNDSALALGKYAGRYSRKHGYPIGEAPDPRYGKVNTYHIDVLESVFGVKS